MKWDNKRRPFIKTKIEQNRTTVGTMGTWSGRELLKYDGSRQTGQMKKGESIFLVVLGTKSKQRVNFRRGTLYLTKKGFLNIKCSSAKRGRLMGQELLHLRVSRAEVGCFQKVFIG